MMTIITTKKFLNNNPRGPSNQLAHEDYVGGSFLHNEVIFDPYQKDQAGNRGVVVGRRSAYYLIKRILDVILAALLLIVLSPVMLVIVLVMLVCSPGPVFFSQERVGAKRDVKGGYSHWRRVTFRCHKFRTMYVDADTTVHQEFTKALIENDQEKLLALQGDDSKIRKLTRDARITRPGKFLRKTSLDELPQLWNVLRGDMSLVGPRPAIPYEVKIYKPWHLERLGAQPGITGLQQVTARSTADFDQQVRLDLDYIKNQSIWLDLKVMLKTPFVILSTKGAE